MYSKEVFVQNETGFHVRPAQLFVEAAAKYDCDIKVILQNDEYDGKSILSLMTMGATKGMTVTIKAEGTDEVEAVMELTKLVENKFYEE